MADDPKLAEFHDNNIRLTQQNADLTKQLESLTAEVATFKTRYDGLDPAVIATERAELAEFKKTNPTVRITELETQLAAEKAARVTSEKAAHAALLESKISDLFLKAGGRPEARAFIVGLAAGLFTLEKGEPKGTRFSPDRPSEPMSVREWITLTSLEHKYAFKSSSGGGADPKSSGGATGAQVLRDPTPQQLGQHADAIRRGDVRVEYGNS